MVSSMDHSKLTVRPAKLEDCNEIINIDSEGKIYDGLDYIPKWIRPLTQDKASNGIVGELDGKIIAYGNNYVIENGTALYNMSGKIAEECRGQGFIYMNLFIQHSSVEALRRNLNSETLIKTETSSRILSPQAAVNLLSDNTVIQRFFNKRYICAYVFLWPVRPTKDNMRNIALRHNVAASFDNVSVLSPQLPQEVTAISFSDITQGVSKFRLDVIFHGKDINLLKEHILAHLRQAIMVAKDGALGLHLQFPLAMNNHKEEIDQFVKTLFESPQTWGRRIHIVGKEEPFVHPSNL